MHFTTLIFERISKHFFYFNEHISRVPLKNADEKKKVQDMTTSENKI